MFKTFFPIAGHIVEVKLYNVDTGETKVYEGFKNLLTDTALELMNTEDETNIGAIFNLSGSGGNAGFLLVGTGSSTPSVTDSNLDNPIAETNRISSSAGRVNDVEISPGVTGGYTFTRREYEFREEEAVGNLTELGLGLNDGTSLNRTLITRQLFLDSNGDPTTITKLSNEILTITYEIRIYFAYDDSLDTTESVNINGQVTDVTVGPINMIGANPTTTHLWAITDSASRVGFTGSGSSSLYNNQDGINATHNDWRTSVDSLTPRVTRDGGGPFFTSIGGLSYRAIENIYPPETFPDNSLVSWSTACVQGNAALQWSQGSIGVKYDPPIEVNAGDEYKFTVAWRYSRF